MSGLFKDCRNLDNAVEGINYKPNAIDMHWTIIGAHHGLQGSAVKEVPVDSGAAGSIPASHHLKLLVVGLSPLVDWRGGFPPPGRQRTIVGILRSVITWYDNP
eukprot:scaffold653446_cov59-Prasinocladus_malaysianus.AAC.1